MDIVVKGRNVEVPDHYRVHVSDKLSRLERYDSKVIRYDVELYHEPNRRQSKSCQRVEITGKGRGPVIRAEATAADFYAALDAATSKIENRLRRAHDRRRVHHGRHNPRSVAEATARLTELQAVAAAAPLAATNGSGRAAVAGHSDLPDQETATNIADRTGRREYTEHSADGFGDADVPRQRWNDGVDEHVPGRIVREKEHNGAPMTVDQALYQMELVGHDFYLFADTHTGRPSVVYRRKGYDYGVISLA